MHARHETFVSRAPHTSNLKNLMFLFFLFFFILQMSRTFLSLSLLSLSLSLSLSLTHRHHRPPLSVDHWYVISPSSLSWILEFLGCSSELGFFLFSWQSLGCFLEVLFLGVSQRSCSEVRFWSAILFWCGKHGFSLESFGVDGRILLGSR
jgi:hypothetical protein